MAKSLSPEMERIFLKETGLTVQQFHEMSPEEVQAHIEARIGHKLTYGPPVDLGPNLTSGDVLIDAGRIIWPEDLDKPTRGGKIMKKLRSVISQIAHAINYHYPSVSSLILLLVISIPLSKYAWMPFFHKHPDLAWFSPVGLFLITFITVMIWCFLSLLFGVFLTFFWSISYYLPNEIRDELRYGQKEHRVPFLVLWQKEFDAILSFVFGIVYYIYYVLELLCLIVTWPFVFVFNRLTNIKPKQGKEMGDD